MATSKLDILINARDNASRQINSVIGALAGLAAAVGAQRLGSMAFDAAVAAGEFAKLKGSFDQLAASFGQNSQTMLAAMRQASGGMISDMDLVQAANRAMMLGVAQDADDLVKLIEVARSRGAAMGLSTGQAFNDIVTGIGRMSPMILDNLGIVTNAEETFGRYAEAVGKTAEQLSDAERKQALLNAVIDSSSGMELPLESAASAAERMAASMANAKVALGDLFSPAVVVAANGIAEAASRAADGFAALGGDGAAEARNIERVIADIKAETEELRAGMSAGGWRTLWGLADGNVAQQIQANEAAVAQLEARLAELRAAEDDTAASTDNAARAADSFINSISGVGVAALGAADDAATAAGILAGVASTLGGIASMVYDAQGAVGALGLYNQLTDSVESQTAAWLEAGITAEEINTVLLPGMLSQQRKLVGETLNTATATRSVGAAARTVNREFSNIESKVSSLLSSMQGDTAGIDADDLLPDQARLDENARRLADIAVNGFKGQEWLPDFAAEVPDIFAALQAAADPQAAAAQLLDDFQDGFLNGTDVLIDKAAAKDRIKRMILGEQSAAQVAEEIAQEIAAEMGVSIQQARAATGAAMGGGGRIERAALPETATIKPVLDTSALAMPFCIPAKICEDGLVESLATMRGLSVQVWPAMPADGAAGYRSVLQTQMGAGSPIVVPAAVPDGAGAGLLTDLQGQVSTGQTAQIEVWPSLPPNAGMNLSLQLQNQMATGQTANISIAPSLTPATPEQMGEYASAMALAVEENSMMFQGIGGGIGTYMANGMAANFDPYQAVRNIAGPMADEWAAQNVGGAMALDFAKQIDESASLWEAGGRRGANYAINGFRQQVMNSDLGDVWISKLAGEVAPIVAAQLAFEAAVNNGTSD